MSKFKVGDRVTFAVLPKRFFVSPEVLGMDGTVTEMLYVSDDHGQMVEVDFPQIGYSQSIPTDCLEPVVVKKPRKVSSNAKSQINRILQYLLTGNSLTPVKAITLFGAYRLAARIYELRAAGHKIKAVNKTDLNGRVYAEYTLRKAGRVGA